MCVLIGKILNFNYNQNTLKPFSSIVVGFNRN